MDRPLDFYRQCIQLTLIMGLKRTAFEGFIAGLAIASTDVLLSTAAGKMVLTFLSLAGTVFPFAVLTSFLFVLVRIFFRVCVASRRTGWEQKFQPVSIMAIYFSLIYLVSEFYLTGELLAWMDIKGINFSFEIPGNLSGELGAVAISAVAAIFIHVFRRMISPVTGYVSGIMITVAVFLVTLASSIGGNSAGKNILLITADTLRMDILGCYGDPGSDTPNIDSLAGEGVVFTNAFAQSNVTATSHSSILTSLYPRSHGVRYNGFTLDRDIATIADVLRDKGYRTGAFIHAFVIDSRFGLDSGFEVYIDTYTEKVFTKKLLNKLGLEGLFNRYNYSRGMHVNEEALPWILSSGKKPFFAWIHYYDPHEPYNPPSSFRQKYTEGIDAVLDMSEIDSHEINEGRLPVTDGDIELIRGLYRGEVSYLDDVIGHLLGSLEDAGLIDSTLVIFTADHGEELFDNVIHAGHAKIMYETVLHVPLILRGPGIARGTRITTPVETRQIPATILGWLGTGKHSTFESFSLLDCLGPEFKNPAESGEDLTVSEAYTMDGSVVDIALRQGGLKYLLSGRENSESIFTLGDGVKETEIVTVDPGILTSFRDLLEMWISTHPSKERTGQVTLDEEDREELKALGYMY